MGVKRATEEDKWVEILKLTTHLGTSEDVVETGLARAKRPFPLHNTKLCWDEFHNFPQLLLLPFPCTCRACLIGYRV
jgi:hypothetical protein